jgi:hypothetical protein
MIVTGRALVSPRLVWLAASSVFAGSALTIYVAAPRLRPAMRWGSIVALPFALTEPLFVGEYWTPPTLLDLARRTRFDVESLVFCLGIGGLGTVLYELVEGGTPQPPRRDPADERWRVAHESAIGIPACLFVPILLWTGAPLAAGIVTFMLIAAGRILILPTLARKTCVGGVLFGIVYMCVLIAVHAAAPAYIAEVWSPAVRRYGSLLSVPVTELAFGISFGLAWSGLYEQLRWTLALPEAA